MKAEKLIPNEIRIMIGDKVVGQISSINITQSRETIPDHSWWSDRPAGFTPSPIHTTAVAGGFKLNTEHIDDCFDIIMEKEGKLLKLEQCYISSWKQAIITDECYYIESVFLNAHSNTMTTVDADDFYPDATELFADFDL